MDIGIVMSAVQTLFAALQCEELKEMCALFGYKSQLEDLQHTVSTVKAVLRDVETKEEELNHEAQLYIEQLKEAVYDADDLFDKFVTLTLRKQHGEGGKGSKKVRSFFSRYNPFGIAYSMSQGVKKIRNKLDTIAKNHEKFGFSIDPQPIRQRREETCSYVYEDNIIGREHDVEKIVGHLLKDAKQDVSFLTIVGMGGLGKTALAQLVFNDVRIKNAFPLRIWTCVSDNVQDSLDLEQIFHKILDSDHEGSTKESFQSQVRTKESLQSQVRAKLTSKKYLLVLDDVWTEDRIQWLKLEEFLLGGQKGSWILLTTRSLKTAKVIGDAPITYELQGLSEEKSWSLFKKIAFSSGQSNSQDDLLELGQEIAKGCARVPLAIRVAASLLYGQDKSKWISFQKMGLSKFTDCQKNIMPILKLSYNQLASPLKSCFTYCAVFPKDFRIDKITLKSLWMAQGYVVPLDDGQTMEDAAEDYFSTLLRRCFFQDARYFPGEVVTCKIHDLMHDIAQNVAGKEICITNVVSKNLEKKVRHLGHIPTEAGQYSFSKTQVRSFLDVTDDFEENKMDISALQELVANWKCLRALDLNGILVNISPLGGLLHLRYLTISNNDLLEQLPNSFTKLFNLQTLRLEYCNNLKELPKDFEKLVNLRFLHINRCGIKQLTSLGNLPHLNILMLEFLNKLEYIFETGRIAASMTTSTPRECLSAEGLLSFPSLEMLELYQLPKLKGWSNDQLHDVDINSSSSMTPVLLPRLKLISIKYCPEMVSNLLCPKLELGEFMRFNKSLEINRLSNVIPSSPPSSSYGVPKLRKLMIDSLGWLNKMPMETFQHLRELLIFGDLEIETLGEAWEVFRSCSSSLVSLTINFCNKLRSLYFQGLEHLTALETLKIESCDRVSLTEDEREDGTSMPWPSLVHFSGLRHLTLNRLKLVNLPNWIQFLSTLETLEVYWCEGLESVPDWMPKLTSLKELRLVNCSRSLTERCRNPTGEDWSLIQHISSIKIT